MLLELEKTRDLSDVVEGFVTEDNPPPLDWLTHLHLERPRRNLHSLSLPERMLKRSFDLLVSGVALVLLLPLAIIVGLLIKLSSPGPIFSRQDRVGINLRRTRRDRRLSFIRDLTPPAGLSERREAKVEDRRHETRPGKPFTLYRFRTLGLEKERNFSLIGGLLKKTGLENLPQMWNVFVGDMSLVGPRPESSVSIAELSKEIPDYLDRLGLRPGLTGLAQIIHGDDRSPESIRQKVVLDLVYLQNSCLWNDVKILIRRFIPVSSARRSGFESDGIVCGNAPGRLMSVNNPSNPRTKVHPHLRR